MCQTKLYIEAYSNKDFLLELERRIPYWKNNTNLRDWPKPKNTRIQPNQRGLIEYNILW